MMSVVGAVRRALNGHYRWGWVQHRHSRYGRKRLSVHVYAPATPPIARTCAHLFRTWPLFAFPSIGAALVFGAAVTDLPLRVISLAVVALLAAVWIALSFASREARSEVRWAVSDWAPHLATPDAVRLEHDQIVALWRHLERVEDLYDRGESTYDEYLGACAAVFTELRENEGT